MIRFSTAKELIQYDTKRNKNDAIWQLSKLVGIAGTWVLWKCYNRAIFDAVVTTKEEAVSELRRIVSSCAFMVKGPVENNAIVLEVLKYFSVKPLFR